MKEFFGCFFVRFSDVFFSMSCTFITYTSLTYKRLFFNFASEGKACCFTSSPAAEFSCQKSLERVVLILCNDVVLTR